MKMKYKDNEINIVKMIYKLKRSVRKRGVGKIFRESLRTSKECVVHKLYNVSRSCTT